MAVDLTAVHSKHGYLIEDLVESFAQAVSRTERWAAMAQFCSIELLLSDRRDLVVIWVCRAWAETSSLAWLDGLPKLAELVDSLLSLPKKQKVDCQHPVVAALFNFLHNLCEAPRTTMLRSICGVASHTSVFEAPPPLDRSPLIADATGELTATPSVFDRLYLRWRELSDPTFESKIKLPPRFSRKPPPPKTGAAVVSGRGAVTEDDDERSCRAPGSVKLVFHPVNDAPPLSDWRSPAPAVLQGNVHRLAAARRVDNHAVEVRDSRLLLQIASSCFAWLKTDRPALNWKTDCEAPGICATIASYLRTCALPPLFDVSPAFFESAMHAQLLWSTLAHGSANFSAIEHAFSCFRRLHADHPREREVVNACEKLHGILPAEAALQKVRKYTFFLPLLLLDPRMRAQLDAIPRAHYDLNAAEREQRRGPQSMFVNLRAASPNDPTVSRVRLPLATATRHTRQGRGINTVYYGVREGISLDIGASHGIGTGIRVGEVFNTPVSEEFTRPLDLVFTAFRDPFLPRYIELKILAEKKALASKRDREVPAYERQRKLRAEKIDAKARLSDAERKDAQIYERAAELSARLALHRPERIGSTADLDLCDFAPAISSEDWASVYKPATLSPSVTSTHWEKEAWETRLKGIAWKDEFWFPTAPLPIATQAATSSLAPQSNAVREEKPLPVVHTSALKRGRKITTARAREQSLGIYRRPNRRTKKKQKKASHGKTPLLPITIDGDETETESDSEETTAKEDEKGLEESRAMLMDLLDSAISRRDQPMSAAQSALSNSAALKCKQAVLELQRFADSFAS